MLIISSPLSSQCSLAIDLFQGISEPFLLWLHWRGGGGRTVRSNPLPHDLHQLEQPLRQRG
jgi:hypothetical protein